MLPQKICSRKLFFWCSLKPEIQEFEGHILQKSTLRRYQKIISLKMFILGAPPWRPRQNKKIQRMLSLVQTTSLSFSFCIRMKRSYILSGSSKKFIFYLNQTKQIQAWPCPSMGEVRPGQAHFTPNPVWPRPGPRTGLITWIQAIFQKSVWYGLKLKQASELRSGYANTANLCGISIRVWWN